MDETEIVTVTEIDPNILPEDLDHTQFGKFDPQNHWIKLGDKKFVIRKQAGDGSCFFHSYIDSQGERYNNADSIITRVTALRDELKDYVIQHKTQLEQTISNPQTGEAIINDTLLETNSYDQYISIDSANIFSAMISKRINIYIKTRGNHQTLKMCKLPSKQLCNYDEISNEDNPICMLLQLDHYMLMEECTDSRDPVTNKPTGTFKSAMESLNYNYYYLSKDNIKNDVSDARFNTLELTYEGMQFLDSEESVKEIEEDVEMLDLLRDGAQNQQKLIQIIDKDINIKELFDVTFQSYQVQNWIKFDNDQVWWVRKQVEDGLCLHGCLIDHLQIRGSRSILEDAISNVNEIIMKKLQEEKDNFIGILGDSEYIESELDALINKKGWLGDISLDIICLAYNMEILVYMSKRDNPKECTITLYPRKVIVDNYGQTFKQNEKMVLFNQENLHWMLMMKNNEPNPNYLKLVTTTKQKKNQKIPQTSTKKNQKIPQTNIKKNTKKPPPLKQNKNPKSPSIQTKRRSPRLQIKNNSKNIVITKKRKQNPIPAKKENKKRKNTQKEHTKIQLNPDFQFRNNYKGDKKHKRKKKKNRVRNKRKKKALQRVKNENGLNLNFRNKFNQQEIKPPIDQNNFCDNIWCKGTQWYIYSVPYLQDSIYYCLAFEKATSYQKVIKEVAQLKEKVLKWCNDKENKKNYGFLMNVNVKTQTQDKSIKEKGLKLIALALGIQIQIIYNRFGFWEQKNYPTEDFLIKNKITYQEVKLFKQAEYYRRLITIEKINRDKYKPPSNPMFKEYIEVQSNNQKKKKKKKDFIEIQSELIQQFLNSYVVNPRKCGYCDELGHNSRNCFVRLVDEERLSAKAKSAFDVYWWDPKVENPVQSVHNIYRSNKCSLQRVVKEPSFITKINQMAIVVQQIKSVASIFCYQLIINKIIDFNKLQKNKQTIQNYFFKIWRMTYFLENKNNTINKDVRDLERYFKDWGFDDHKVVVPDKFQRLDVILKYVVADYITNMSNLLIKTGWEYVKWKAPISKDKDFLQSHISEPVDDDVDIYSYKKHKENPFFYLHHILGKAQEFEDYYKNKDKKKKINALFPLYDQIPGHIRISEDTWSFLNIHQFCDLLDFSQKPLNKSGFASVGPTYNSSSIDTDLIRFDYEDENIIADDPGATTNIHATNCQNISKNEKKKKMLQFKYTAKERKDIHRTMKSRASQNRKLQENKRTKTNNDLLSQFTHRTFDPGKFAAWSRAKLPTLRDPCYEDFYWRTNRLCNWISKAKGEDKMLKRLKKTFNITEETKVDKVFAIGSWALSEGHTPGHGPVLKSGFIKLINNFGIRVLIVGEYKTSSVCNECKVPGTLRHPIISKRCFLPHDSDTPVSSTKPHGLLKCSNCKKYWDRNQNAAQNIHAIAKEWLNSNHLKKKYVRPSFLDIDHSKHRTND